MTRTPEASGQRPEGLTAHRQSAQRTRPAVVAPNLTFGLRPAAIVILVRLFSPGTTA
jgi:hypothetical protein